jgi:hypothetical protein
MEENLVGYLLNALDDPTHQQVEAYLRSHPAAQQRLESLRKALGPLTADKDEIAPPAGLAFRTLAKVAEYRCRAVPEPPAAPPTGFGASSERRWWGRIDMLVAACILLVLGGLTWQSTAVLRATSARLGCADNLRLFHQALMSYSDVRGGELPGVPLQRHPLDPVQIIPQPGEMPAVQPQPLPSRNNVAGIFVVQLRESGCLAPLTPGVTIRCPGNGDRVLPTISFQDLDSAMTTEEFDQLAKRLAGCYAYSLGYRDPSDNHCGLRRDLDQPDLYLPRVPIMADRPAILPGGGRGNTPNHKGGQNVLFLAGNVRFCSTPDVGIEGDNIYLNKEGKVGAGINRWDTVLGCSADKP